MAKAEKPTVWVLLDDRVGNNNQSRGLARKLGFQKELVQIEYNAFATLPNAFRDASLLGVASDYKLSVAPPYPDIVIAAGRRLAPVARYVKKMNPKTKLIHIMRPEAPVDEFEAIILPEHDAPMEGSNIIRTTGALSGITHEHLEKAATLWSPHLNSVQEPRTALLIGGDSKGGAMTPDDIKKPLHTLNPIITEEKGSLLVTTSRRTSEACIAELKNALSDLPHHLHLYSSKGANPYEGFLALAERIIVTGESVSMCSEAAFTGKPVYIHEGSFMTEKNKAYISSLYAHNVAKPLSAFSETWRGGESLDEAARVADLIRNNLS